MTENMKNKYDRVMPRVYNQSRSSLKSGSIVTRHETPSSVRLCGKPSVSNVNSAVFNDLPTVLSDYKLEIFPEKPVKRTFVVKPRRTVKSLDPALSPPRSVRRSQELKQKPRSIRVRNSAPSVLTHGDDKWPENHIRQCYSSRSHAKLKELKDEIKAYQETDNLMRLRSHLYKSCGVILDDIGQVAADKAVQVEPEKTEKTVKVKWKNMRAYFFKELKKLEKPDATGQTSISWPLFNQLLFLKDKSHPLDRDFNISGTNDDFEINVQDCENQNENQDEAETNQQPLSPSSSDYIQVTPKKKFKPESSCFPYHSERLLQLEAQKIDKIQKERERESDSDSLFFQSLVPFMREFPLRHKLRLRSKIQDLILKELESIESQRGSEVAVSHHAPVVHVAGGVSETYRKRTASQQSHSITIQSPQHIKEEFLTD